MKLRDSYDILRESWFISLDWFGKAEDEGRTELPSEHKKQKEREEGKVLKSNEVNSAVILIVAFVSFFIIIKYIYGDIVKFFNFSFEKIGSIYNLDFTILFYSFLKLFFSYILLFSLIVFIAAILVNIAQFGFLITFKPISPKPEKLIPNISKWLRNSFASAEALFNLFKSLLKIVIISLIYFLVIKSNLAVITRFSEYNLERNITVLLGIIYKFTFFSLFALMIFSLLDYLFQRNLYIESLKMTKEELKQERKELEGDPHLRARIREKMRDIFANNIREQVPKADVVITNPVHYAVAVKWDSKIMLSPQVIAKGEDKLALLIKSIALEHDIPVVENKPLARALYINVEVGDELPREYWELMSKILVKVYSITKQFTQR